MPRMKDKHGRPKDMVQVANRIIQTHLPQGTAYQLDQHSPVVFVLFLLDTGVAVRFNLDTKVLQGKGGCPPLPFKLIDDADCDILCMWAGMLDGYKSPSPWAIGWRRAVCGLCQYFDTII